MKNTVRVILMLWLLYCAYCPFSPLNTWYLQTCAIVGWVILIALGISAYVAIMYIIDKAATAVWNYIF